MKAKTIAVGGLLALVALALAAVIAANPFATQAASQDTPQSQITSPEDLGNPQMAEDEEPSTKPYIGIYIAPDPDGGVMVLKVMEYSPSDGVLQAGDVITAANSETVDGPNDLIDAVAEAGVGGNITLTVTRDGQSMDVTVTVGEREVEDTKKVWTKPYIGIYVSPGDDGGVEVVKVMKDSPSDGVLQDGDVITSVDSETVNDSSDLIDAVAEAGVGGAVTLTVTRDGQSIDVTVTVGEHKADDAKKLWTKPYIGIVVTPDPDGVVEVVEVMDNGPSNGVLQADDVITAANGEAVSDSKDLINAIVEAGVGGTITLTVTRDDQSMDVTITVGERTEARFESARVLRRPFTRGVSPVDPGMLMPSRVVDDRFASSRIVVADDDGNYRTHRTVAGTVTTVDADAGTFTLQPKDGSATIDYTINDDTVITMSRTGDLGQLNTTDPTMVMDVDGEVKWIRQGNPAMRFDRGPRAFPGFSGAYRQFRTGPEVYIRRVHDDEDVMELLPRELREKINSMRSGGGGGFNLPGNGQTPPAGSNDTF